jgi:hypothetical protein
VRKTFSAILVKYSKVKSIFFFLLGNVSTATAEALAGITAFKKLGVGAAFFVVFGKRFSGTFSPLFFAFLAGGPVDDVWSVDAFEERFRFVFFVSPSPRTRVKKMKRRLIK